MSRGFTNREIATELMISLNTIKMHMRHILAKLGAANRAHAITLAREQNML